MLKRKDLMPTYYKLDLLRESEVLQRRCLVYKSGLFSNFPPFCFLGTKVRVSKVHWTENATEHGEAAMHCSLESAGGSASLFSVTWYWAREHSGSKMLAHLQHDGLLEYGEERLRRRLRCHRSSPTDFILKLHRVEMEDAGEYWCRVAEWQLHGTPSKWVSQASDESPHMVLTVLPSGNEGSTRLGSWAGGPLSPLFSFPSQLWLAPSPG